MYDKEALNISLTIDTVYGYISKYAICQVNNIDKKETLQNYLQGAFKHIENVVLQDFEKIEKTNKISEIDIELKK